MTDKEIDKLFDKREKILEKLSYWNNPPMFSTQNYEPHKKRARKRLHEIAEILHKELNVDKKRYAF